MLGKALCSIPGFGSAGSQRLRSLRSSDPPSPTREHLSVQMKREDSVFWQPRPCKSSFFMHCIFPNARGDIFGPEGNPQQRFQIPALKQGAALESERGEGLSKTTYFSLPSFLGS